MMTLIRQNFIFQKIFRSITAIWFRIEPYRRTLLRVFVILFLLLITPAVGFLITKINPILILIAATVPLALMGLQFILPRSELGPILILIAAAFIPLRLPTGTESELVDSFLLTLLFVSNWLVYMIFIKKRLSLEPTPANKPIILFIFTVLFSIIWSTVFRDPLVDTTLLSSKFLFVQIATGLTMIMLPGAFLLVANHINNIKLLKAMVIIMIIAGTISGLVRFVGLNLPESLKVNDDGLFSMWIVGISIGLVIFVKKISWGVKISLLVLGGLWIFLRFFIGISWLAGWLPSIIALGILLALRSKKLLFVVMVLGIIYLAANSNYYFGTILEAETDESGYTRMAAWEVNWRVTGKHLLFGTGPAGYAAYYMSYYPTEGMATHNSLMDTLAQTGIVGLFFLLWFFAALIRQGYQLCRQVKGRGDFTEAMAMIALAGTIGTAFMAGFGDWLFPFTYTQTIAGFDYIVYSWMFMGTIPALYRLTQTDQAGVTENA